MSFSSSLFAAESSTTAPKTTAATAEQDVALHVELVGTAKHWMPEHVNAKPGKIKFELKNDLAEPHGFEIKGLAKPIVVPAKGTMSVTVDAKTGEYVIGCQLHPKHVSAKLDVK